MRCFGFVIMALALTVPAWAADRDDGSKSLRVAQSLVEWGDCDAAIPWLEQALDRDPGLCRANYYLAKCLMEDPQLEGGRQVRSAVDAFEDCAEQEWADDVAELRVSVPSQQGRRSSEDAVSDRDADDGRRETREVQRPEGRGERDEVRQERSGSNRTRQGRDYWKRSDGKRDNAREPKDRDGDGDGDRDDTSDRRDRDDTSDRRDRDEEFLTEIEIEDDEPPQESARSGTSSGRRVSTLPDLDDEEQERPGLRGKDRNERDPWEDDEKWKDPYLDD